MQYLFLFPLCAGIINGILSVYIFAISDKNSAGRAYSLYAMFLSLWGFTDAVSWLPCMPDIVALALLRVTTIYWVPNMFLFLNLIYKMISRPRDPAYHFFLWFAVTASCIGIFSSWMLAGLERKPWGIQPVVNPMYFVVLVIAVLICGTYAFFIALQAMKRLDDILLKKQMKLTLQGILIIVLACLINGPLLLVMGIDTFPFMLSTITTLQSVFIYLAIIRHQIFSIDLKKAASEIFSQIQDGVILLDNRQMVVEANITARKLFSLSKNDLGPHLDIHQFQLHNYEFQENYVDKEISISKNGKELSVLMSQWPLLRSGVITGKIIILKDISPLKNALNDVRELNVQLEKKVETDKEKIDHFKTKMMRDDHLRDLVEITSGVLHNVKNVLNSIKISANITRETLDGTAITGFKKANDMLRHHFDDISNFITKNPKGKMMLELYLSLEDVLDDEIAISRNYLNRIIEGIHSIEGIVNVQQNYNKKPITENIDIEDVIKDALTMLYESFEKHRITLEQDLQQVPQIKIDKYKVIHVLVNLIKNAKEAMTNTPESGRKIVISTINTEFAVRIEIRDKGDGIAPENLEKIFEHGFTTKNDGHGFGLKICHHYMTEMNGKIWAESKGAGKGTTMIMEFPKTTVMEK